MRKLPIKIGEKYGRWTVVSSFSKNTRRYYTLICDCGNFGKSEGAPLYYGRSKSCGCLKKEDVSQRARSHGLSSSRTYQSWEMMKQRCNNITYDGYLKYGGVGISICQEWDKFEKFYEDMGERPVGTSLNRRLDTETNEPFLIYSKETCEWANLSAQSFDCKKRASNTSGKTGVCLNSRKNRWKAFISKDKISYNLGEFDSFEEAVKAREEAEIKYYGRNRK